MSMINMSNYESMNGVKWKSFVIDNIFAIKPIRKFLQFPATVEICRDSSPVRAGIFLWSCAGIGPFDGQILPSLIHDKYQYLKI